MKINRAIHSLPVGFTYRMAVQDDQNEICDLVFSCLEAYGLVPEPTKVDADLYKLEATYKNGFFGVLEAEGKIVATFGLLPLSAETVELRKMYSLPEVRGKGLGKWMVNYTLQLARENNFHRIELETASPLIEAIGLYKKLGFKEIQFEHKTPRCDKAFEYKIR